MLCWSHKGFLLLIGRPDRMTMLWQGRSVLFIGALGLSSLSAAQRFFQALPSAPLAPRYSRALTIPQEGGAGALQREFLNDLFEEGHLQASFDTCTEGRDTTFCALHVGPRYEWAQLRAGSHGKEILTRAGFREKLFLGTPVRPQRVARLMSSVLDECESTGYPFAAVRLDSLEPKEDGLHASLLLDQGKLVVIDSIRIKGTARTNIGYLHAYLGIRPGDPYDGTLIKAAEQRMRELPYVLQKQRPYVQFQPDRTVLYLFLDDKKASSLNGLLGILPDPTTGEVLLTGDLDLKLRNALRRGESIDLNWRKLQDRTQELKLRFYGPCLLRTPFGADLSLNLFRRDSTFLEVTARAAGDYALRQGEKVSVFVNNKSSRRLGRELTFGQGLGDVALLSYGAAFSRERFDKRYNPRKGSSLTLEAAVGEKRTTTALIGDTVSTRRTDQYDLNGKAVLHAPLGKRSTLRFSGTAGRMVNDDLFRNELYRLGGIRNLRGVDEASIFCSGYAVGTMEYRFLFEENSNLLVFFDQAWWEDRSADALVREDKPFGFGVGSNFETKAGIFSITYALGRQFENPVELRGGKVHFGFSSLF
jgi:outer membrane protein assembly factor BamA